MIKNRHVLIVGGGIGGLTAALCLARVGAEVTVFERAAEPREVGAGILLMNNGLAVLNGLGLEKVRQNGYCLTSATLHGADGRVLADMPIPDFGPGLDYALMLRRSTLHEVLLDAVRRQSGVTTRFGANVIAGHPAGQVTVEIAGEKETVTGDLVVAADGVRSILRRHGDFGARVRDFFALSIRGMVPVETPTLRGLQEYWSPVGVFGGAPMGDGSTYFFTSATKRPLPQAVATQDLESFRTAWRTALPPAMPVLDHVETFDQLYVTGIVRVDCDRWVDGKLVLLGDAAHAMPPNLGQGGSSAIIDAAVLAFELIADRPLEDALQRYAARRRLAVRTVQARVSVLFKLTEAPWPVLGRLCNLGVRLARHAPRALIGGNLLQEDPAKLYSAMAATTDSRSRGRDWASSKRPAYSAKILHDS